MVTLNNLRLPVDSMVFPLKCNGISLTVLLCLKTYSLIFTEVSFQQIASIPIRGFIGIPYKIVVSCF